MSKNSRITEDHVLLNNKFETANKNISSFFSFNKNTKQTNRELNQNIIKILRLTVLQKHNQQLVLSLDKNSPGDQTTVKRGTIKKVNRFEMNYRKYYFLQTLINSATAFHVIEGHPPFKLINKNALLDLNKSKKNQRNTLVAKKYLNYYYNINENSLIDINKTPSIFNVSENFADTLLDKNVNFTTIKQKSFLSYWLLPIVGFYSILASSKPINGFQEYVKSKQSHSSLDFTKIELHPVFNSNAINENVNNQIRITKNEISSLNQLAFKSDSVSYLNIQNKFNIEMDQLAISYLQQLLTPEFKNLIDYRNNVNTNKLETNSLIKSNQVVNQYKVLKSRGLLNWYQLPIIQTKDLSYSDRAFNFANLTQPVNGIFNNKLLESQFASNKTKDGKQNQFSWNILNTVNPNVDILNTSKQKTLLLNNQILDLKHSSISVNNKSSSEQSKFKKILANLKFKKISFVTIKPSIKTNEFSFFENKQTFVPKYLTIVSYSDSSKLLKSVETPFTITNWKEQACSFPSNSVSLDLTRAKSSVQQFKQISLFLDNLIANYNWNITKNVAPNTTFNSTSKLEQKSSLHNPDSLSKTSISNYIFKTQFKEKQLLSKENILDLLNTQLNNSMNVSDKSSSNLLAENNFVALGNINNLQKSKTASVENKTNRAFNYELDSVFNYLSLNSLNQSASNPNWTSGTSLKNTKFKTFIKIKTPLVTTNPQLFSVTNANTKTLEFKAKLATNNKEKSDNMMYVNVDNPISLSKKETNKIELETQTNNNTSFKYWIAIKTNLFNNYLKYIQHKLNGFYKINMYNSKLIFKNALVMNTDSKNASYELNYSSNSLKKQTFKNIQSTQIKTLSTLNKFELNYTNSLPIVLKHKKLLNLANPILTEKVGSNNELEQNFINSKKDLQKKHRAKKQRLESRRQKKRKRFYPRPVWLRLRLAFDFNTIKKAQNNLILSLRKNHFALQSPAINANLKTSWDNEKSTLNSYLNSLSNINKNDYLSDLNSSKGVFIPSVKTFIQYKQTNLDNSLSQYDISPYKKKTNNYQYNNIVFNLWLSSKKIKLFNNQVLIQKFETNSEQSKDSNIWNTSKVNCYTNKLKRKLSNKKQNVIQLSDNSLTKSIYQDLSQYAYKEKLFLTRKALVEFKNLNGKQYTIFENKSNANPPKKTNEDNLVRDFWIWLYNLTTRNQWTNTALAKTGSTNLSVPIQMTSKSTNILNSGLNIETPPSELADLNQNSLALKQGGSKLLNTDIFNLQQKARLLFSSNKSISQAAFQQANSDNINRIHWALNKTNLWSSTTKRLTLWSSQKLRNQSKNNKTKYIEKQIQKQMNSAFSNLYLKSFLTKSNNNYYKFNITQKIHQKEQKLAYLNGIKKMNQTRFLNNSQFFVLNNKKYMEFKSINNAFDLGFISKPTVDLAWWNGINVNKAQLQNRLIKNGNDFNTITELTNTFYFNTLKKNSLTSSFHKLIHEQKMHIGSNSSFLNFNLTTGEQNVTEEQIAQTLLSNNYNISLLALLFHFCALISLISISQIRCFLKFHLILVHKLSNFYLQVIYKNLAVTAKMFGNLTQNNQLSSFFNSLTTTGSELTKKSSVFIPTTAHLLTAEKLTIMSNQLMQSNNKRNRSIKDIKLFEGKEQASSFQQMNKPFVSSIFKKSNDSFNFNNNISKFKVIQTSSKLHKSFSFDFQNQSSLNTFKASTNNIIFWNWSKHSSNTNNYYLRYLAERFTVNNAFKKEISVSNVNFNNASKVSKMNSQSDQFTNKSSNSLASNLTIKKTNNLLLLNSFIKKYLIFANLVQYLDKSGTNKATKNSKKHTKLNKNLKSQNLAILSLTYQLGLTELTKQTVTTVKKGTLETTYKIVDSFEYCLKLIYSFFEKPAEFTMDWIAYAFLVEWSSDLLAFTPEKTEKQSWLAFSKILRGSRTAPLLQNQIYGAASLNTNSSLIFTQNLLNLPLNLTLGQLLYKRLLYLNDTFLEILNRPDTDLMNRQKKGTLFWDIWSDVLIKAADKYNINVPSLSNIKEEQNTLIDKVLADNAIFASNKQLKKGQGFKDFQNPVAKLKQNFEKEKTNTVNQATETHLNKSSVLPLRVAKLGNNIITDFNSFTQNENVFNLSTIIKSTQDVNQFVTYQSKETDLFLDYHPPKSFKHISAIRYYNMVQQPIGALVCQIYSGLLTKQIAKNVLVIGSTLSSTSDTNLERSQKTLLIQALAGETEIKIITDNASRYAIVNRGFAVGIKLLKDVFEAISLNTPCLFLLEDIHLIGERRPLLISDHGDAVGDELSKSTETTFGAQRNGEAVHEKNQVLYQLSRHGIAHYKKPFKGDFSLSIPTNHFGFDLFLKSRYANYSSTPTNPLSYGINLIELEKTGSTGNTSNTESNSSNLSLKLMSKRSEFNFGTNQKTMLATSLQMADTANQLLSPPSTSPFTVLLLKEQKKLKPKRIVKELPWIGLPSEQLALLPRVSYSVRAKVAALADLGFSNMSAKLDMITDLLVIIDSVRGNRGFVVFATTHLPHILDPALRRPGRLDETISIPTLSNIWTRWEFTKAADPIMISKNSTKMYFPNTHNIIGYSGTFDYLDFMNLDFIPNITGNNNFFNTIVTRFNLANKKTNTSRSLYKSISINSTASLSNWKEQASSFPSVKTDHFSTKKFDMMHEPTNNMSNAANFAKAELTVLLKKRYNKYLNQINQIAYYQMGKKFITNQATFTLSSFSPIYNNPTTYNSNITLTDTSDYLTNQIQYNSLYSSPNVIKKTLIGLLSGKLSQLFALQTKPLMLNTFSKINLESGLSEFPTLSPLTLQNTNQIQSIVKNVLTLYGIDETWRAATTLALSFIQKRYLYNKNLIVPKLLNFQDYSSLEEPPSPPTSNILIPAKRYENSKKALKENIERKVTTSIQDKLEAHNKQSYIKTIYNIKQSQVGSNLQTLVNPNLNSLLALDSYTQPLTQPSSITWHYQNKLLKRHRNYLNNQWWNGQLTEHNAETLFLSDIDWRYTFIDNLNNPNLNQSNLIFFNKLKGSTNFMNTKHVETSKKVQTRFQDIVIDFPDADQHYNPKHRRWMVTSGDWNSWFNIDKKLQTAIFEHLIIECMIKTYTIFDQNRELLDYSASKYMKKGLIKELNTNFIFKKFGLDHKQ